MASMGFHEIALDASRSTDRAIGEDVRRSYRTMDLSLAADARIEVSVWLKATVVIVSVEVGQAIVSIGVEFDRLRS